MKKLYVFTLSLLFSLSHYGQSTIATIDRVNGPGPTATATVENITAIGLTRTGVIQNGASGSISFTSRNWERDNINNRNFYIQWSITANPNYIISLTELAIRYRRSNNQAPKAIHTYYSLDNFDSTGPNPEGFPVGTQQTYSNNENEQNTLLFPLANVESGNGGTITFRFYGWNAPNRNGEVIIEPNPSWAGSLGIADPGIRLQGFVFKELVYSGGTWTPNAPSASSGPDRAIVVDGTYTPTTDILLNSLTVRPEGNVSIPSGITLNCNSSSYESISTQFSSLILDGTMIGTVNYSRHVNSGAVAGVGGNDLIAAPLSGQSFGAFAIVNDNIITDPNNTNRKLFGPFDKSSATFQIYDTSVHDGVLLTPGTGYRSASTDNGNFTFTGTANNSTINQEITYSGPQFAPWNLIGNPYPSYLYVKEKTGADAHPGFLNENIDQFDPNYVAIYGYDDDGSDGNIYTIWNLANTLTSTVMTPGQGFFVASNSAGGSISFTPGMRSVGNTDDFILGRTNEEFSASLRLKMSNGNENYFTDIYFNEASTLGLDPGYDSGLFGGNTPAFSIFSQLVENNAEVNMAIQSLPYSSLTTDIIIPIGLRVSQGQQITISVQEMNLPPESEVYFEDTLTNTSVQISAADYVFTSSENLNGIGRFYLRISNSMLSNKDVSINNLQIYSTASPRTLVIKGVITSSTQVFLYDLQGRMVLSSTLNSGTIKNSLDVSGLGTGMYVIRLTSPNNLKTHKIIIK
jgi:hypothetical protein